MNWDVQAFHQISVRTNISNVNRQKYVSHKAGTVMVQKIVTTNQTNRVLVVPSIVLITFSNVKTKNVFTKVLFAMVKMTVEMDLMNQPMMVSAQNFYHFEKIPLFEKYILIPVEKNRYSALGLALVLLFSWAANDFI